MSDSSLQSVSFNESAIVGDSITASNARWTFGGDVPEHFDEHVSRSVPLYQEGHDLVARLSDFYLSDGSVCYDIGCSTGTLLKTLAERHAGRDIRFIGYDREAEMVDKARQNCAGFDNVTIEQADIMDIEFRSADMIVSYLTLQFIRPKYRQQFLDRIYQSLNWGGSLFLFEKVRANDARFQDIATSLYQDYKLDQGYTAEEIISKTRSLKGYLEPFSTQGNLDLLKRAGFVDILTIMKFVCFEAFLSIK